MTQVHLALVESQIEETGQAYCRVGIAFPGYTVAGPRAKREKVHIGSKLRLFAESAESLDELRLEHWLRNLSDYVHLTSVRQPPKIESFVRYRRVQAKSSLARLARRQARRQGKPLPEIAEALSGFQEERLILPYIDLGSQSSRRRFRLFIQREDAAESPEWRFSTYGLSPISTVPSF
jgi:CRISPR-associated endonuclease Csy4